MSHYVTESPHLQDTRNQPLGTEMPSEIYKASSGSFALTLEVELVFTATEWVDRITVPGLEVFFCAAMPFNHHSSQPECE
ncbi:hypothetical protein N7453_010911 [Penicillium expansum]|nr:hypothetical protein N7453_010911 [Penicillium expansum]